MQERLKNLYQQVSSEAAASGSAPAIGGTGSALSHGLLQMGAASARVGAVGMSAHAQLPQGPLMPPVQLPPQGPVPIPPGGLRSQVPFPGGIAACSRASPQTPGVLRDAAAPLASRCAGSSSSFGPGLLTGFPGASLPSLPSLGQPASREALPHSSNPDGVRSVSTECIAGMDMIGELFQQQAKRLEVQLYQQLRDRKQIEMVNVQLQQNVQQLQQLQQQNALQSRLIEANEQSLHAMYEQARTIHGERNTVVALCERLAQDAHALRQSLAQENPRRYGHLESIPITQVPKTRFDLPPITSLFSQSSNLTVAAPPAAAAPGAPPTAPDMATGSAMPDAQDAACGAPDASAAPSAPSLLPGQPAAAPPTARSSTPPDVPAVPTIAEVEMKDAPALASGTAVPTRQETSLALLSTVASHSSASRPNLTAKPHRGANGSDEHSNSSSSSSSGRRNHATAPFPTLDSSVSGNSGSGGSGGSGSNRSGSNEGSDCAEDGDSTGSDSGNGDSNGSDSGNGNGSNNGSDSNGYSNGDSSHGDSANGEGSDSGSNGNNASLGSDHGEGSDSGNGGSHEGSDSGKGDGSDNVGNGSDAGDSGHGEGEDEGSVSGKVEGSDLGNPESSPSPPPEEDDVAIPRKRAPRGKSISPNPSSSASKRRRS